MSTVDQQAQWTAVDEYFAEVFVASDPALDAALAASADAGLPPINVAPNQGKLLHLLAMASGAKQILEIGTLGGYSTIWLARGVPAGGRVITLELDPKHARVATESIASAGLADRVQVRVGPAVDSLASLSAELADAECDIEPFDMIFIDADKPSNPDYFEWSMRLIRPGGLLVIDNVVRGGAIADADSESPDVQGTRRLNDMIAATPRVNATAVQTVGSKGYDGFTLAVVG